MPQFEVGQPFQADTRLDNVRLESLTYAKLMHYRLGAKVRRATDRNTFKFPPVS